MRTPPLMMLAAPPGISARCVLALRIQRGPGARFDFPFGTLPINVAGCFLLSLMTMLALSHGVAPELRLILGAGFCGAFTAFTTFKIEADELLRRASNAAFWYLSGNLMLGFAAILVGRRMALQIVGRAS